MLALILVGWVILLPAAVITVLLRRPSRSQVPAGCEPVDADALIEEITAFAAGRAEPAPSAPSRAAQPGPARS